MTFIEKAADKLFLLMCSVIDQKCQGSLSCQHRSLKLVHLSSVENTQSKRASRRPSYHAQSENGGTEALVTTGLSPLGEPWSYSAHIRVLGAPFWQKGTPVPFHMKANTVADEVGWMQGGIDWWHRSIQPDMGRLRGACKTRIWGAFTNKLDSGAMTCQPGMLRWHI